jgi:tetratricopeptide (TPR) repeat protein
MYERVLDLDPGNEIAREALGQEELPEEEETIDLDAVLREVEPDGLQKERAEESDPSFAAMLSQFRAKVTDHVEAGEAGDHYDLGLAFKEMGLIDEAIAEFQTALTGGTERLKVYEELGQCFLQKNQPNVALKVLTRALQVPSSDEAELLGVYYHLGQVHEELGQRAEARQAYQKVLTIDASFGDVSERVARL